MLKCAIDSFSDIGQRRPMNQDFFMVDEDHGIILVADGMGGHAGGEVASREAVEEAHRVLATRLSLVEESHDPDKPSEREQVNRLMREAIQAACAHVFDLAHREPELAGMGTTLTALLLQGTRAYIGHVGDSRAYLVRDGKIHRLTDDHRVVDELLRRGALTPEEARIFPYQTALSRSVGVQATVQVDVLDLDVLENDRFFLCTDGLYQYLDAAALLERLDRDDIEGVTREMVSLANEMGGSDNITAVLLEVSDVEYENDSIPLEKYRRLEIVRRIPFFSGLDYKELVGVLGLVDTWDHEAGQEIVREGDCSGAVHVILYGAVRVMKGGVLLAKLGPEELFGEDGFLDNLPSAVSIVAEEVTRTYRLDRRELLDLMQRDPFLANKLVRAIAHSLAEKFRTTVDNASNQASVDAGRVAAWTPAHP